MTPWKLPLIGASLGHKSTIVRYISQKLRRNTRKYVADPPSKECSGLADLAAFPSGDALAIGLQYAFVFSR